MNPVLILQHLSSDGPAYLGTWLARRGIAFEVRNTEAGEAFPDRLQDHSALVILGGEMSANDALPSLRQAENLFLQAVDQGLPTLGHCLGGQLMARALGARVLGSPAPEIGWQHVAVLPGAESRLWLGEATSHQLFHWHSEAFELPSGCTVLASSRACPQQAFALGPHLAMQFHIEIDAAKMALWIAEGTDSLAELRDTPTVQSGAQMLASSQTFLADHQRLADHIYAHWWAQVKASRGHPAS